MRQLHSCNLERISINFAFFRCFWPYSFIARQPVWKAVMWVVAATHLIVLLPDTCAGMAGVCTTSWGLQSNWGTCNPKNVVTLHWRLCNVKLCNCMDILLVEWHVRSLAWFQSTLCKVIQVLQLVYRAHEVVLASAVPAQVSGINT